MKNKLEAWAFALVAVGLRADRNVVELLSEPGSA